MKRHLSVIAAMSRNGVIGDRGKIPWHLPAELQLFKRITTGHYIVMGRKTWESIERLLPGRITVIVTRELEYWVPGAIVTHSLEEALAACEEDKEVFVVGGADLFQEALPLADQLYLTVVDAEVNGDTVMPPIDFDQWEAVEAESFPADEKNAYAFCCTHYQRKGVLRSPSVPAVEIH